MKKMKDYIMYGYWDKTRESPVAWQFDHFVKKGETFDVEDVQYKIIRKVKTEKEKYIVVRMVRSKILGTTTQQVHKCPARKEKLDKLDKGDKLKLEDKYGKKYVEKFMKGRSKMRTYNKLEIQCPDCKVVFWKDYNGLPETVKVNKVMNKKRLIKR